MKRKLVIASGVIAVIIAVVIAAVVINKHSNENITYYGSKKTACQLLQIDNAKALLGASAYQQNKTQEVADPSASKDLKITKCVYTLPKAKSTTEYAILTVKTPISKKGISIIKQNFSDKQLKKYKNLKIYGDVCYWNETKGELHIHKQNTWYIVANGVQDPSSRTLSQAEDAADMIVSNIK